MSSTEVWTPEIQFTHAYNNPIITKPMPARLIDPTNNIIQQRYRAHVTFRCDMNFDDFPFDTQVCQFVMFLLEDDITLNDTSTNEVLNTHIIKYNVRMKKSTMFTSLRGSIKWPMIGFNITLVRKPKMFLVATYLPSTIFVVISWMR